MAETKQDEGRSAFFAADYVPDYNELIAVQRASRRYHYTAGQRWSLWLALVPCIGFVAAMAYFDKAIAAWFQPLVGRDIAYWMPIVLFAISVIAYMWFLFTRLLPGLSAKWLADRKPLLATAFHADDQGLNWVTAETRSWVAWSAVERIFVTTGAVCFLYGGFTLYLPKRLFSDAAAMRAFLDGAIARLGSPARALSEADASVLAVRSG